MKFAMGLCLMCLLLPVAPVDASFAWQRLPTAAGGDLVFADVEGFTLREGTDLRLYTLDGDLRRTVKYQEIGQGKVTWFADAWAIEIGGNPPLRVYNAEGKLVRTGTAAEVTGQTYLPTSAAKFGKLIWLKVYGGSLQLDTESWTPVFREGGEMPDSPWGEESLKFTRRLTVQPAPTLEETIVERFLPDGTKVAEFSLPVWSEGPHCLLTAYPLEDNEVVLSSGKETVVLDRRTLVPRQRFPWNSCLPLFNYSNIYQAASVTSRSVYWWRGAAVRIESYSYRSGERYELHYGDHRRVWGVPADQYSRQSPLRWYERIWNTAGRIYTQHGTGTEASYGFFDLSRPSVRGGGLRRVDFCLFRPPGYTFSLPVSGGQGPYSCFKPDGTALVDCQYTVVHENTCVYGPPRTSGNPLDYYVVDARGDREKATMLILPLPGQEINVLSQPVSVHEFYNDSLNHYFMTINEFEREFIARGDAGPGWADLGARFLGWLPRETNSAVSGGGASNEVAVCRFYGKPGLGPNSHFYTLAGRECEAVKQDPGWVWEAENTFFVWQPNIDGTCPPWSDTVWRAYNNRHAQNDANHRYATDRRLLEAMASSGWTVEGVAFCAPKILN